MTAWAQEYLQEGLDAARRADPPEGTYSLMSSLASAAGGLLLVLALLYAVFFVLRRWGLQRGWVLPSASPALKVLGSQALDSRRSLYLVQVGETLLVVGAGASDLSLLHAFKDPGEVRLIRTKLGLEDGGAGAPFEGALASAFDREAGDRGAREGREAVDRARRAVRKVLDKLGGGKP